MSAFGQVEELSLSLWPLEYEDSTGSLYDFKALQMRPRRRQNQSCDQCRAGKRACDVSIGDYECYNSAAGSATGRHLPTASLSLSTELPSGPCSNCVRWNKGCTIGWALSHQSGSEPPKKRRRQKPQRSRYDRSDPDRGIPQPTADDDCTEQSIDAACGVTWNAINEPWIQLPALALPTPRSLYSVSPTQTNTSLDRRKRSASQRSSSSSLGIESAESQHSHRGLLNVSGCHSSTLQDIGSEHPDVISDDASLDLWMLEGADGRVRAARNPKAAVGRNGESHREQSDHCDLSGSDNLAGKINRLAIKKSLVKVYHDSLEGALSCWLTERNCPYISTQFNGQEVWASSWSNRIVTRVCHLDRSYMAPDRVQGSKPDESSQVMNLAMMAFASQWAQSGDRFTQRLSGTISGSARRPSLNGIESRPMQEEFFGRSIQVELWHNACAAVQKAIAAGDTSFKVIFACIILSIAQRPFTGAERDLDDAANVDKSAGFEKLHNLLSADGAPLFLDLALRLLHDHRRRMHNTGRSTSRGASIEAGPHQPSGQDKQTFDMLFWLAIMFDSLSAAMNRRAFVVSNEDSKVTQTADTGAKGHSTDYSSRLDLDGWNLTDVPPHASSVDSEADLWGRYFLHDRSSAGQVRMSAARWPCSYEDAAAALCDAAPVKVLLYRRVAQLQDLLYRPSRAAPQAFEDAIEAAIEVYDYWNTTYGLFIQDCSSNHEELSARIQSWYILLAGHWHLAVFLLADTIDDIDTANLSDHPTALHRQGNQLSLRLRTRSAQAVADLGRNSRYTTGTDSSFSQSPDFHFAVNKAALLTEPWTVVLVRSFSRAGEFFAKQILDSAGRLGEIEVREAEMRLRYCIDALWLLGKKSDMALMAARLLGESVEGVADM